MFQVLFYRKINIPSSSGWKREVRSIFQRQERKVMGIWEVVGLKELVGDRIYSGIMNEMPPAKSQAFEYLTPVGSY